MGLEVLGVPFGPFVKGFRFRALSKTSHGRVFVTHAKTAHPQVK